jgi:hypothetical protein
VRSEARGQRAVGGVEEGGIVVVGLERAREQAKGIGQRRGPHAAARRGQHQARTAVA